MDFPAVEFAAAPVTQDPNRDVRATISLRPGDVIFAEIAIVASANVTDDSGYTDDAPIEESVEGIDDDEVDLLSTYVQDNFVALIATCEPLQALTSVSACKNLFKCFHLLDSNEIDFACFRALYADVDDYDAGVQAATALRAAHPSAIPKALTTNQVAHLIGVLATHSLPIDCHSGPGSALFLHLPKLKHSCIPNTSVHFSLDSAWVTAIRDIAEDEALTLDLYDTHYTCVAERRARMAQDSLLCGCGVCRGRLPDKTRAFQCTTCVDGIVHPTRLQFACTGCGTVLEADAMAVLEREETTFVDCCVGATSLLQFKQVLDNSVLHPHHHIVYAAMDTLRYTDRTLTGTQTLEILNQQMDALNYVVPYPHGDKVTLYNLIGKMHVTSGDIAKAKDAYTRAYEVSVKWSGPDSRDSIKYKTLMEHTPTSVAALHGYDESNEMDVDESNEMDVDEDDDDNDDM
ncbi:Aste57867_1411 [Aphanomyces stellatus]|uniref:Aste57867_1411 protein n=1 Tax=Aphanomyces stellatus TaxID=120398 RepID=A0A485K7S7_9STRA|nr:hypothetical protein As57867_001410 [Aphanomyces stellatus]VFT78628.1 Aste57867_1411 [Aphanomyces stellatus]